MTQTIVTHSGTFHADDVFAVATLLSIYPGLKIIRSRDSEAIKSADIAVDVGGINDSDSMRFDHHQEGGAGVRDNSIPYASFGLVWKKFGEQLSGNKEIADRIEEKLVLPIDAGDSGISLSKPNFENIDEYTISDLLKSYVDRNERTSEYFDEVFMKVVEVAKDLLKREINNARVYIESIEKMKEFVQSSDNKTIIILDEYLPWRKVLTPIEESLYVLYPRIDGKWGAEAVYKNLQGFERKKLFPESWAGKKDEELAEITGVSDATFCHNGRFIAVALSKEGALKLAEIALNT